MGETSKTRDRLKKILANLAPEIGPENILDIGCGTDKIVEHALGLDSRAVQGVNLVWRMPATGDVPFADDLFDLVYSSHTLEDFEDTLEVLVSWWRVVRPGGFLALYLPHADWYPNIGDPRANAAHKHDFRPADIQTFRPLLIPEPEEIHCASYGPPGGRYDYDNRGHIEYSFLIIWRKPVDG